jgi:DnaJ-class molecular chaperone
MENFNPREEREKYSLNKERIKQIPCMPCAGKGKTIVNGMEKECERCFGTGWVKINS